MAVGLCAIGKYPNLPEAPISISSVQHPFYRVRDPIPHCGRRSISTLGFSVLLCSLSCLYLLCWLYPAPFVPPRESHYNGTLSFPASVATSRPWCLGLPSTRFHLVEGALFLARIALFIHLNIQQMIQRS